MRFSSPLALAEDLYRSFPTRFRSEREGPWTLGPWGLVLLLGPLLLGSFAPGSLQAQSDDNQALQLDGTDDRVVVPDDADLRPQALTVEAWVKESGFPNYASVLTKTSSSSWEDGFGIAHYNNDHDINFFVDEWDGQFVSGTLNESGWTHVAGTYDGATLRLYIDGELVDTGDYDGGITHSSNQLLLGNGEGNFPWEGELEEVRIWNEARSQQEIQSAMRSPLSGTEAGLVGYWPLDGSAQDASGGGNDGTVEGASFVPSTVPFEGAGNYVVQFDRTNVGVEDASDINTTSQDQRTIGAWFRAEDPQVSERKQVIYEEGGRNDGFNLYVYNGALYVGAWSGSNGWDGTWLRTTGVQSGQWHHVALVFDAQSGSLTGYLDGVEFGTETAPAAVDSHSGDIGIGAVRDNSKFRDSGQFSGSGQGLTGAVDEVRIWNRARSASALRTDRFRELSGGETGLVAYWPFNEGRGQETSDATGRGHEGTLNGAGWAAEMLPGSDTPIFTSSPVTQALVDEPYEHEVTAEDGSGTGLTLRAQALPSWLSFTDEGGGEGTLSGTPSSFDEGTHDVVLVAENGEGDTREQSFEVTVTENYALQFESGDDVSVANARDINTTSHDQRTIEAWVQVDDASVSGRKQIIYEEGGRDDGFNLYIYDGALYVGAWSESNGWDGTWLQATDIQSGSWHHVALVYDAPSDAFTGYLDGMAFESASAPVTISDHTNDLGIGALQDNTTFEDEGDVTGGGHGFAGTIDEVRIWNRARSASAIQDSRFDLLSGTETDLVAYWPFNEGSGQVAADATGRGHEGTITGAEWTQSLIPGEGSLRIVDGGECAASEISLSWNGLSDANAYRVDVASRRDPEAIVDQVEVGDKTSHVYDASSLEDGDTYYGRVAASSDGGTTYDTVSPFTDGTVLDRTPPEPNKPAGRTEGERTVSFTFSGSDNVEITQFHVQVADNQSFDDPIAETDVAPGEAYTFEGDPGTTYYARARGTDCAGNQSGYGSASDAVTLEPLPDLTVTGVKAPETAVAGNEIEVEWTTENTGQGPTRSQGWKDAVFLVRETDDGSTDRIRLGRAGNASFLEPGQKYRQTLQVTVPLQQEQDRGEAAVTQGNYDVVVQADQSGSEAESEGDNNEAQAPQQMDVSLPPLPDLVVTKVFDPTPVCRTSLIERGGAATTSSVGYAACGSSVSYIGDERQMSIGPNLGFTYGWEVTNRGEGPAEEGWRGTLFFQQGDGPFDLESATLVGSVRSAGGLAVGDTTSMSTPNPTPYPGDINEGHFYVVTDAGSEVFEGVADSNNVFREETVTQLRRVPPSDLEPTSISAPSSAESSDSITVEWTTRNNGPNQVSAGVWQDRIYLSSDDTFNPDQDTLLQRFFLESTYEDEVPPDTQITLQEKVHLPDGVSGSYYLFADVDATDRINERVPNQGDFEDNNHARSGSFQVDLADYPDLTVSALEAPSEAAAGSSILLEYEVQNEGPAPTPEQNGGWTDRVYIARQDTITGGAETVTAISVEKRLSSQQSYRKAKSVRLPRGLEEGTYFLHAAVNDGAEIYEHGSAAENNASSTEITVEREPRPDLQVTSAGATGSPVAGQPLEVSWRVENKGSAPTESTSWLDEVYLSSDTTLNADADTRLGRSVRKGQLKKGEGYDASATVGIPGDAVGERYLIFATDSGDETAVREMNSTNNTGYEGVTVTAGPQPDLRVSSVEIDGTPTAAQPLDLIVTVVNEGEDLPARAEWWDAWTFAETPDAEGASEQLRSIRRSGPLAAGASYTDTVTVEMPRYAKGQYYVVTDTDSENFLDESRQEANNRQATPLSVTMPPPSNLVVENVKVPAGAQPGEEVTIQYDLVNTGDNPAQGTLDDAAYVSADQALDTNDPRLGLREGQRIDLDPSQSKTIRLKAQVPDLAKGQASGGSGEEVSGAAKAGEAMDLQGDVPGLTPGDYHVIVWADVRNNIRETDDFNNRTASSEQTTVSVPELTLGTPEQTPLAGSDQQRYYKVNVTGGKDLRLTLDSQTDAAREENFELFVARGRAPTPGDFDAAFQAESDERPRVLVPETQAGTYYVMARNPYLSDSADTEVTAQTFGFSLFEATPGEGGSSGRVVSTLSGAQLGPNTTFYLTDGTTRIDGEVMRVPSTMEAEVRFDLRGQPLGSYDVVAEQEGGAEVRLEEAFDVVTPVENQLQYSISAPPRLRIPASGPVSFPLTVKNENNIDADIVVLSVMAPGDEKFSVRSDAFTSALLVPENTGISQDSLPGGGLPVEAKPPGSGPGLTMGMVTMIAKDVRVGESLTGEVRFSNLSIPIGESLPLAIRAKAYSEEEFEDLIREKSGDVAQAIRKFVETDTTDAFGDAEQKSEYLSDLSEVVNMSGDEIIDIYRDTGVLGDGPLTSVAAKPVYDPETARAGRISSKAAVAKSCAPSRTGSHSSASGPSSGSSSLGPLRKVEGETCSNFATAASVGIGTGTAFYSAGLLAGFAAGTFTAAAAAPLSAAIALTSSVVFTAITIDSALNDRDYGLTGDIGGLPPTSATDVLTHPSSMEFICSTILGAFDPNDIVGPSGTGPAQWVRRDATLPYKIRFENDPDRANVPARNVVIRQPLDSALDARTVRLQRFGFGGRTFEISGSRGQVQRRIDVRDSLGVYVDVNAGLDSQNGELFFSFRSIDPATGQPPTDPTDGFLPVNDSSGVGEGFVEYTVEPRDTASSGTEVTAQADIVFDQNAAIETPEVFNTIDGSAPTSHIPDGGVSQLSPTSVQLNWEAADSMPGSGTQTYAVYAAPQGESFKPVATGLTDTTYVFEPDTSGALTYRFFTVAEDQVSNQEPTKLQGDVSIAIPVELSEFDATLESGVVVLNWTTASETESAGFRVERSVEGGPFEDIGFVEGAGTTSSPQSYRFRDEDLPFEAETLTYRLRQVDLDGTTARTDPVTVERDDPKEFVLRDNYPNPSAQRTTVPYELARPSEVQVRVFDILGRKVIEIPLGQKEAGRYTHRLGVSRLASGAYFYELRARQDGKTLFREVQKITVVR